MTAPGVILGGKLFQRDFQLTVGSLNVSKLACEFHVEKTLKPTPNTAVIKIHNLSPANRKVLESNATNPVRLSAGYQGTGLHQIYFGEVRSAWSEYQKTDVVTVLETGDAEEARIARLHVPVGPSGDIGIALRACVAAMGVKSGNLEAAIAGLKAGGAVSNIRFQGVISGNAWQNMTDFCRSAGLEWSIQDGVLQILNQGAVSQLTALRIAADSGLIGSPTISLDKRLEKPIKGQRTPHVKTGKQVVTAHCQLLPDLGPGRLVVFDTVGIQGGYRVEKATYVGDTHGETWGVTIDCTKV